MLSSSIHAVQGYGDACWKAIQAASSVGDVLKDMKMHILWLHKRLSIELDMFPSMPMHMYFLGVLKSLLDVVKSMKAKQTNNSSVNEWWRNFMDTAWDAQSP